MEKRFIFVGILMILPVISYGQSYRFDYTFDQQAGGWLKFHRMPLRWDQAHLTCYNEGAVLASPSNKYITKALTGMMMKYGITTTPIFTGISNKISNSIQKSIEGVPISNTFTQTLENCVGMNTNGTSAELSCLDYHPFACFIKKEPKELTECGTSDPEYMLDNRTGNCYKVHRDQHKWSDASKICTAEGGHLAIINSQDEADVIWELAKDSLSVYAVSIGFFVENDQYYGYRQRTWTTVQGTSLEQAGYARWYTGEPNSPDENCGSVIFSGSKEDGILNDVSCNMDLTFICEIEPNSTVTPTPPSTVPAQEYKPRADAVELIIRNEEVVCNKVPECDTLDREYILNNRTGSCYKVHRNTHTWSEAYQVCVSEGGHLAVINSQEEAEIVWNLADKDVPQVEIFLGFRAFGVKPTWITVQGQTLADAGYNEWYFAEPHNPWGNQFCGGISRLKDFGRLVDVNCDLDLAFVCEIEPRASSFILARN